MALRCRVAVVNSVGLIPPLGVTGARLGGSHLEAIPLVATATRGALFTLIGLFVAGRLKLSGNPLIGR